MLIAWLLWLPALGSAELHHALVVSVDPDQHGIEVQDTINTVGDGAAGVEFALHPELTPELVGEGARLVELGRASSSDTGPAARRFRVELATGQQQFTLRYRGRIMHALRRQGEEYAVSAGCRSTADLRSGDPAPERLERHEPGGAERWRGR